MVAEETNASRPMDGGFTSEEAEVDNFPVGMRVLAVDDDPACLKLLEALLRKCQYHVTTTNQAVKALKMLRKNKDKFDLVISDVQMPDMDGFKLLEHVGLEMDLPVIMLSAYSDTKFVMKGISHGACDYLLKPVRMEELKNIWQHVIRRKKFDPKNQNRSPNPGEAFQGGGEDGQGPELTDNVYLNGKHGKKRKDQDEDDDEENANENEDPSNQKKARVVWSVDLHRKFVAAVNQLGIDKAFPKRILDLMNVEGLTRENVASHLQKYRLYLKRISSVASQQVNLAADHSYLRMNPLNEFAELHTLSGSGRLLNASLSSYAHVGRVGRLNAPTNFGSHCRGLTSGVLPSNVRTPCSPINAFGKFHPVVLSGDRNANIFPGVPVSLDLEQLHQNKFLNQIGNSNPIDDQAAFSVVNDMLDTGPGVTSSSNSVLGVPNNPLLLQENPQKLTASRGGFVSQLSLKMACLNQKTFKTDVSDRINENLQSTVELSRSLNFTSASALSSSFEDSRGDLQCQEGLLGNIVHNVNQFPMARWEEHKQDSRSSTSNFGIFNPLAPAYSVMEPLSQIQIQSQLNGGAPSPIQPSLVEEMVTDTKASSNEDYLLEQRSQGGFVQDDCESLEDLMAVMIKQRRGEAIFMDGQFRVDSYSHK